MKYRVKGPDRLGCWKTGEIGEALPNDSTKYDLKLDFGSVLGPKIFGEPGETMMCARVYYFHKDEVEPVEESTDDPRDDPENMSASEVMDHARTARDDDYPRWDDPRSLWEKWGDE